jgi:hypothetical protein
MDGTCSATGFQRPCDVVVNRRDVDVPRAGLEQIAQLTPDPSGSTGPEQAHIRRSWSSIASFPDNPAINSDQGGHLGDTVAIQIAFEAFRSFARVVDLWFPLGNTPLREVFMAKALELWRALSRDPGSWEKG